MKKNILTLFISIFILFNLSGQTVVDIIVNSPDHNTLEAAVIAAELDDDLSGDGPFTVFAPTDAAFDALPPGTVETLLMDPTGALASILLYHVIGAEVLSTDLSDGMTATTLLDEDVTVTINNGGIFINNAQVTIADIMADNGVVHVIDAVLLPTPPTSITVVDVIVNSEIHNTLEAAVIAAELDDDLSGEGPFTVFAPTDDAFAALPEGTVETLLMDPTGDLANILLYHVLGANVLSTDLSDGMTATTLLGEDVTVTINDDGVFINDAQVIVADIMADNGVVHVIDAVLLPPAPEPNGTARVQIIHNAESETIQILANGEVLIPFLANKMVTSYMEVPAGVALDLELDPTNFWSMANSVNATVTFEAGKTYQVVASGTFDESDEFPVRVDVFDSAIETTNADEVGLQFFHGSYDAPTVDIVVGGSPLFDDVSYGSFGADFISVPANDTYRLVVTPGDDNNTIVAQYDLYMAWWKGNTATIYATGSLTDGTFQPWVALSGGGAYPLFPVQMGRPAAMSLREALNMGEDLQAVQVFPNPAKYETTVNYTLDDVSDIAVRLFSLDGKMLKEISYRQQLAGEYQETISVGNYEPGMYYIQLNVDNIIKSVPLLIVE